MENLNMNVLYEICKYLDIKEMSYLKQTNKTLSEKVEDAMIILSEREAHRILLSSNKINRNPFVDHETPKFVYQNKIWYEFLVSQVQKRKQIRYKLFELVPQLFSDCESSFQADLANLIFVEIKHKRQAKSSLQKDHFLINLQTEYQELLLKQSNLQKSTRYECAVVTRMHAKSATKQINQFIDGIYEAGEADLLCHFVIKGKL